MKSWTVEKRQLDTKINFDLNNMHKFIRDRIPSEEGYIALEIENYCIEKKQLKTNKKTTQLKSSQL